jgi:hypothetical protein
MRLRRFIYVSIALNCVLAAAVFVFAQRLPKLERVYLDSPSAPVVYKTNYVLRKQNFTWQELETDNYKEYIAKLRGIGCPEKTIQDILLADINELYGQKMASVRNVNEEQWWKSDPDAQAEREKNVDSRKLNRSGGRF